MEPITPDLDERRRALARREGVGRRAVAIHRRRVIAPRATFLALILAAAVAIPFGLRSPSAARHLQSPSHGSTTTGLPKTTTTTQPVTTTTVLAQFFPHPSNTGLQFPIVWTTHFPYSTHGQDIGAVVLSPASALPAGLLCEVPLGEYQDGTVGPDLCSDGAVNVYAWEFYADTSSWQRLPVFSYGPGETAATLKAAVCQVFRNQAIHFTGPEFNDAIQLAGAYYGWHFKLPNPTLDCS